MMAAKAGAKMVSACDFNETLFSLSRDIVAANELGGTGQHHICPLHKS